MGNIRRSLWGKSDWRAVQISCFGILIWFLFEPFFIGLWNQYIVSSFLSKTSVISLPLFTCIIILLISSVIFGNDSYIKNKTFIPYKYLVFISVFIIMYLGYRFQGIYIYYPNYCGIGILDLIILFGLGLLLFAVKTNLYYGKEQEKELGFNFYNDSPLGKENIEDVLGFELTVKEFFLTLKKTMLVNKGGLSIGINGKWGEGKSSFMYLLRKNFENSEGKNFILLEFNPRHVKSHTDIQFEFFQMLFGELKKYDIRFSNAFSNYLKAIKVIDNTKIFDFLKEGHNVFFAKESEKENINEALQRINKQIVVFIDDFDRLLPAEILEVFKLIDGNASFKGIFFITAYDKEYINKILSKDLEFGSGNFIDKFFAIEKSLPYVPLSKYSGYLISELKNNFGDKISDEEYRNIRKYAETNLATLRDCKRFLNLFVDDYHNKMQGVQFADYFVLTLINYRWRGYYEAIRDKRIVEIANIFINKSKDRQQIYKKEKWEEVLLQSPGSNLKGEDNSVVQVEGKEIDENFKELFQFLFREDSSGKLQNNLSISKKSLFDNYFYPYINRLVNPFTIESMFSQVLEDNIPLIKEFFKEKQTEYLFAYIYRKDLDLLEYNNNQIYNFIDIVIFLLNKVDDFNLRIKLIKLISKETVDRLFALGNIKNKEEYKSQFLQRLRSNYSNNMYPILGLWIRDILRDPQVAESTVLVEASDLLEVNKDTLKVVLEKKPTIGSFELQVLYSCIKSIDGINERSVLILDEEACGWVKDLIKAEPNEYLKVFVRTSQSFISCEPFCVQIFGDENEVEDFLYSSSLDTFAEITKIRNVWGWYRLNNCESIDADFTQEEVKNMMENDFTAEAKLVQEVNGLLDQLSQVKESIDPILIAVKKYTSNSLNLDGFIDVCKKQGIELENYKNSFKNLLVLIKKAKKIHISASKRDDIVNFDWKTLKLLSGGKISVLEELVNLLENEV